MLNRYFFVLFVLFGLIFLLEAPVIYCESKGLMVIPDILPSTVGMGKFTRFISNRIYLTPYVTGIVVGVF